MSNFEEEFIKVLEKYPDGLRDDVVSQEIPTATVEDIAMVINSLSKKNRIEICKFKDTFAYKLVDASQAHTMATLEADEKLIYSLIKASHNQGIWVRTLKAKTNLHQKVVNKCLKSMEAKAMIKAVKSVKNPTHKLYMLMEVTPSLEITGGYPRGKTDKIYPANYPYYPTASQIHQWIKQRQISHVDLSVEDIISLLDVLVFDGKIEKHVPPYETAEGNNVDWMYKAMRVKKKSGLENWVHDSPCGQCPVMDKCTDNGLISPATCVYFDQWLF